MEPTESVRYYLLVFSMCDKVVLKENKKISFKCKYDGDCREK